MKAYNSDITVEEFIARHGKPYDPATDNYFREPFAQDTKVGKNSAIYNAHSCYVNLQEKRKTLPLSGTAHRLLHFPFCTFHAVLNPACGRLTNDRKLLG